MWEPQLGDWYPGTVRRMGCEWDDGKKTPFTVMLLLGIVGTAQHETRPQPGPSQELGPDENVMARVGLVHKCFSTIWGPCISLHINQGPS